MTWTIRKSDGRLMETQIHKLKDGSPVLTLIDKIKIKWVKGTQGLAYYFYCPIPMDLSSTRVSTPSRMDVKDAIFGEAHSKIVVDR